MLVLLAIVTVSECAVVPMSLPMVKPDTSLPKVKLEIGHVKVPLKLLPKGCTVNVPLVEIDVLALMSIVSAVRVMLLLLLLANEPLPHVPFVLSPKPPAAETEMGPLATDALMALTTP
jgi:hypothetical protein